MHNTRVRTGLGKAARRDAITEYILDRHTAQAADLAQMFGVSLMTIHRDLDDLAAAGLVRRFHGGARALRDDSFEPEVNYRLKMSLRAKREIAAAAVSHFVEPGMSILLDDSTSALAVARLLPSVAPVTVITNFLEIFTELAGKEGVSLHALGGEYSVTNHSFQGAGFLAGLDAVQADIFFGSSAAMSEQGVFHQESEVFISKRALMDRSARKILLMDHTKLGHTAIHRISPLDAWDAIIVDSEASEDEVAKARAAGATVIVAPPVSV